MIGCSDQQVVPSPSIALQVQWPPVPPRLRGFKHPVYRWDGLGHSIPCLVKAAAFRRKLLLSYGVLWTDKRAPVIWVGVTAI